MGHHCFINLYSKYHSHCFIHFFIVLAPVISSLDQIYCTIDKVVMIIVIIILIVIITVIVIVIIVVVISIIVIKSEKSGNKFKPQMGKIIWFWRNLGIWKYTWNLTPKSSKVWIQYHVEYFPRWIRIKTRGERSDE